MKEPFPPPQDNPETQNRISQTQERPRKEIRQSDFIHPVMGWTMYDRSLANQLREKVANQSPEALETQAFREASRMVFELQPLDLDVRFTSKTPMNQRELPLVPGIYDFQFTLERDTRRFHGIVIDREGRLEPNMSAHAIYLAQVQRFGPSNFEHVNIHALHWDPESATVHVVLGST